jgi:nucleotide-binding universal stress UspA family protein
VALDGTDRGRAVLDAGAAFASALGADLRAVTVEPVRSGEPDHLATANPAAGTLRLRSQVRATLGRDLLIRRGDAAEQILLAVEELRPDVLVLGCHRGGPPGILEAGSTARRLAHTSPCAVMTVPL